MKAYTIGQYLDAGCPFANDRKQLQVFMGVHQATGGKVCDTGCAWFVNGTCRAYKTLTHTPHVDPPKTFTETVRDEATRRGLSINAVRRERNKP